jgi:hypothetical protein
VPHLYRLVAQDYEDLYIRLARDIILQQAGEYPAPMYWQNRTFVGEEMMSRLNSVLNDAYANCTGFMLLRIDLPDSYEQAIVDTQVVNQKKNTQESIRNATVIRTGIEVDRSNATMQISVINAGAESQALITKNLAQAQIINNTVTYQNWAYNQVQDNIGLNSSAYLLDYIFYLNLMNLDKNEGTKLVIGVDSSIVNLGGSL